MQKTALIVNPDAVHRETLHEFLSAANYQVLAATRGDDAVDLCRTYEGAIDLLVTDADLPGTSGWRLAEIASGFRPGLMVLFLSPSSCDDPFSPNMLLRVTQALSRRAQHNKRLN
ncbi:MAG: response regulator [Bryobacteraceae bacterium]